MKTCLILLGFALALPAYGQTMYKCPNAAGTVNFQQMPCTPQGGGEEVPVKTLTSGQGAHLSENAIRYLQEQTQARQEAAAIALEEAKRREALNIERGKVRAAEEQAAAQRATARAIWATGRRY